MDVSATPRPRGDPLPEPLPCARAAHAKDPDATVGSARHLYIYIDLYNKCNLRCTMCTAHSPDEAPVSLSPQRFATLAQQAFPRARQVNLSCAYEPLMHKTLFDDLAVAAHYRVPELVLTTNGTLLTPDKAQRLIDAELTRLHVSIDGSSAATYEAIRRPARFATLLDNLTHFNTLRQTLGRGPALQLQMVVMPENQHEVPAFVERFATLSPQRLLFIHRDFQRPQGPAALQRQALLRQALQACAARGIAFGEYPEFCIPTQEVLRAYGGQGVLPTSKPGCVDPWNFLSVKPDGSVAVCPNGAAGVGNLNETDLAELWNGPAAQRLRTALNDRQTPAPCQHCAYRDHGVVQIYRSFDRMQTLLAQSMGQHPGAEVR
ncbi:MAG: hypothetical protein Fur007_18680 [Rhodoferax sp.]